ncbi:30S ribosomal protein S13 [Patescibacteria group bacterium]
MARIAGVNLPQDKRVEIALTYIHGIGRTLSNKILTKADIDQGVSTNNLTPAQESRLREIIEKEYKVEGELRRDKAMSIKRLKEITSYRGSRHAKSLPGRGQRTRRNSRTTRGNRRDRSVGSGRRPAAQKT